MKGGKPIASGSAGCVFKPALLCDGESERKKDYITKVMYSYNAEAELREMKMVTDVLKDIKDNEKYFLANNISKCHPDKMDADDIKGRKEKCSGALDKFMSESRFQEQIDKKLITGINIPYGGKNLNETIVPNLTSKSFLNINKGIIKLIKHGIVEFNKRKLLHLDVKHLNMLYNPKDKNVRLIDWGICAKYTDDVVTEGVKDRNLMFNRPIVNFLFDHHFTGVFKRTLQDQDDISSFSKAQLADLLTYIFRSYLEPSFKGIKLNPRHLLAPAPQTFIFNMPHYYIIADFFKAAFKNKLIREQYPDLAKMNEAELMSHIIRECLIPVMVEFFDLKTLTVDRQKVFDTSYKFNVDIYGALTSYMSYISNFNDKLVTFKKLDNADKLQLHIFNMMMKYMFSRDVGLKPYNIPELLNELQNLERVVSGEPLKKLSEAPTKRASPTPTPASVKRASPKPAKQTTPVKQATPKKTVKAKGKRCKNGFVRNKVTGECEPKHSVKTLKKSNTPKQVEQTKKRKRCPNGLKRDKKTGECVPK